VHPIETIKSRLGNSLGFKKKNRQSVKGALKIEITQKKLILAKNTS